MNDTVKALEYEVEHAYANEIYGSVSILLLREVLDLIRHLQDENEQLKCKSYRTSWRNKFLMARAEIETQRKIIEYQNGVEDRNTELQRQVDELTDKLGNVSLGIKADEVLIAKGVGQAVKDTVKEILSEVKPYVVNYLAEYTEGGEEYAEGYFDSLCSRYGVEVE